MFSQPTAGVCTYNYHLITNKHIPLVNSSIPLQIVRFINILMINKKKSVYGNGMLYTHYKKGEMLMSIATTYYEEVTKILSGIVEA